MNIASGENWMDPGRKLKEIFLILRYRNLENIFDFQKKKKMFRNNKKILIDFTTNDKQKEYDVKKYGKKERRAIEKEYYEHTDKRNRRHS